MDSLIQMMCHRREEKLKFCHEVEIHLPFAAIRSGNFSMRLFLSSLTQFVRMISRKKWIQIYSFRIVVTMKFVVKFLLA